MNVEIILDKNGRERAYHKINGKKMPMKVADAKAWLDQLEFDFFLQAQAISNYNNVPLMLPAPTLSYEEEQAKVRRSYYAKLNELDVHLAERGVEAETWFSVIGIFYLQIGSRIVELGTEETALNRMLTALASLTIPSYPDFERAVAQAKDRLEDWGRWLRLCDYDEDYENSPEFAEFKQWLYSSDENAEQDLVEDFIARQQATPCQQQQACAGVVVSEVDKVETLIESLEDFQEENTMELYATQENVRGFWQRRIHIVDEVLSDVGHNLAYNDAVLKLRKVGILVDEEGNIQDGVSVAYEQYGNKLRELGVKVPLFDLIVADYNTTFGNTITLKNSNGDKLLKYDVSTGSGKLLDGVIESCVAKVLKVYNEFKNDCIAFCESYIGELGSKLVLVKEAQSYLIQNYPEALVQVLTFFLVEDFLKPQATPVQQQQAQAKQPTSDLFGTAKDWGLVGDSAIIFEGLKNWKTMEVESRYDGKRFSIKPVPLLEECANDVSVRGYIISTKNDGPIASVREVAEWCERLKLPSSHG